MISIMTKTQIQLPEELFAEIREFARRREWSLAETFRRGAELLLEVYPREAPLASQPWQAPISSTAGWKGLSAAELKELAFADENLPPQES
ncbi:antitoxin [Luteolibacter sp. Populi]|uniref:antitoxin n=1 Tax=Luteolibacter sp. Populi TaxID=3230487 RepID=UPI0034676959